MATESSHRGAVPVPVEKGSPPSTDGGRGGEGRGEAFAVTIPTVHLSSRRVNVPKPPLPHGPRPADAVAGLGHVATGLAHTVTVQRPRADKVLFYGGLATLAGVGAVAWPTAAAIGAGVWIASRGRPGPQPGGDGSGPTAAQLDEPE